MFNPGDYYSSVILADFIKSMDGLKGKYVLDMGCGSGIVSIFAASMGASCLAVDVNPASVKSALENAENNGFGENIKVIQSDLFERVPDNEKFDMIFFNPPYYEKEPESNFEKAFYAGKDFRIIKEFLIQSRNHLKSQGQMFFIISSDLGLERFKNMLQEHNFELRVEKTVKRFFETFYITKAFF